MGTNWTREKNHEKRELVNTNSLAAGVLNEYRGKIMMIMINTSMHTISFSLKTSELKRVENLSNFTVSLISMS